MKRILDAALMKRADSYTIETIGIPSLTLMERAAFATADEIRKRFCDRQDESRVLILAGCGNNGGDGIAAGRILEEYGFDVTICLAREDATGSDGYRAQLSYAKNLGMAFVSVSEVSFADYGIIIDAIFGIGLSRDVTGIEARLIEGANAAHAYRVAVDIASGVSADRGLIMGCAFRAGLTVTFAYGKAGQYFYPGASCTGELEIRPIGISMPLLHEEGLFLLDRSAFHSFPCRKQGGNKGTYGRVLVIAGSQNMYGACRFCAEAAYRSGAGLVEVMTDRVNRDLLMKDLPEAVMSLYDPDDANETVKLLNEALDRADAVLVGPGLGRTELSKEIVRITLRKASCPVIIDADGLRIVSEEMALLETAANRIPVVLTPHPGELGGLTGLSIEALHHDRVKIVRDFAREHHVILAAKDARTLVALPDGRVFLNCTGNDGMGTGGTGDVLAGLIAGLTAQTKDPAVSTYTGVLLHGMMGDKARTRLGERSLLAGDLLPEIASVMKELDK
ncbi:MAG: NAD(P)H-hydrate dehydratase [Lachnospiraceae bacterium]|nr:NAD(P)H-hydrate dehydratase [Lachnospiraceae bacterium]